MHAACLVPCVIGSCPLGREGPLGCVYCLPWRSSFPRSGSCCVSKSPRGFLYLSAGVAVIGKIGGHVRLLPQKKRRRCCSFTLPCLDQVPHVRGLLKTARTRSFSVSSADWTGGEGSGCSGHVSRPGAESDTSVDESSGPLIATEQCGLTPAPTVCTALSLGQALTPQFMSWSAMSRQRQSSLQPQC